MSTKRKDVEVTLKKYKSLMELEKGKVVYLLKWFTSMRGNSYR